MSEHKPVVLSTVMVGPRNDETSCSSQNKKTTKRHRNTSKNEVARDTSTTSSKSGAKRRRISPSSAVIKPFKHAVAKKPGRPAKGVVKVKKKPKIYSKPKPCTPKLENSMAKAMFADSNCIGRGCCAKLAEFVSVRKKGELAKCKFGYTRPCRIKEGLIRDNDMYFYCPSQPLCDVSICNPCFQQIKLHSSKVDPATLAKTLEWAGSEEWDVMILHRFAESGSDAIRLQKALKNCGIKAFLCDCVLFKAEQTMREVRSRCKLVVVLGSSTFGTASELALIENGDSPMFYIKMASSLKSSDARAVLPDNLAYTQWLPGTRKLNDISKQIRAKLYHRLTEEKPVDLENRRNILMGYKSGRKYVGDMRDGLPHGKGIQLYPDGSVFVGKFYKGKRQGLGSYLFGPRSPNSGDTFTCNYLEDKRHGRGKYVYSTLSPFEGYRFYCTFEKGVKVQPGTMVTDNSIPRKLRCPVCTKRGKAKDWVLCNDLQAGKHGAHYYCLGFRSVEAGEKFCCNAHSKREKTKSKQIQKLRIVNNVSAASPKDRSKKRPLDRETLSPMKKKRRSSLNAKKRREFKLKKKPKGSGAKSTKRKAAVAVVESKNEDIDNPEDEISMGEESESVIERVSFVCIKATCGARLSTFTQRTCEERGIMCDFREGPQCSDRWGRILKGSKFYSCSNFPDCDVDICDECFPYHSEDYKPGTEDLPPPLIKYCTNKKCKREIDKFIERKCENRGMICDMKLDNACRKRFGKISLESTFYSCPNSDDCSVDICNKCHDHIYGIVDEPESKERQLKNSLYLSEELSANLRQIRKDKLSTEAALSWPPVEAQRARKGILVEAAAVETPKIPSSSSASPETRDLVNVISRLSYT